MTLISLEDAKAEVRKVVSDFKTRYDINYRLNNLPSIELEDEAEQTEPSDNSCKTCRYGEVDEGYVLCKYYSKDEQTEPNCETCIHYGVEFLEDDSIDTCLANECHYEPKQTEQNCSEKPNNCDEPQTDCAWK